MYYSRVRLQCACVQCANGTTNPETTVAWTLTHCERACPSHCDQLVTQSTKETVEGWAVSSSALLSWCPFSSCPPQCQARPRVTCIHWCTFSLIIGVTTQTGFISCPPHTYKVCTHACMDIGNAACIIILLGSVWQLAMKWWWTHLYIHACIRRIFVYTHTLEYIV